MIYGVLKMEHCLWLIWFIFYVSLDMSNDMLSWRRCMHTFLYAYARRCGGVYDYLILYSETWDELCLQSFRDLTRWRGDDIW